MKTVTHMCTIDCVARKLCEDVDLFETNISHDDNLTYGNIVSIYAGTDETVTAPTHDDIEELTDMIRDAPISIKIWHEFFGDCVDNAELVARIKAKPPR